ncbi:MAG: GTP 3',8-cyclase MoaA [Candidatus Omnitrophota bacterium]|nr:GTP 3',8-cyclase MoaA [Candidatus Omnitrophota bacterium]
MSVDYLRFSLTDRCNLNCFYCAPLDRRQFLSRREVLTYEEIIRTVSLFVKLGIKKLRLTGGEPLIKKDIVWLIGMLKAIKGLDEIAVTTNGIYLEELAYPLKNAGLDRLNISIDTLKTERYKAITGFDQLKSVRSGIEKAIEAGFDPVKLNVILMKGVNDDEVEDFIRLTFNHPLIVRFIEFFPTNKRSLKLAGSLIKNDVVKERINGYFGKMERVYGVRGNGPAEYYKLKGSKGSVGFISSASENFCAGCNRIRIDCAGRICPCLFSGHTHDIKPLLRDSSRDDESITEYIKEAFEVKSKYRKNSNACHQVEMSSIGG